MTRRAGTGANRYGIIWPFPTYSQSQFRRVDQGQDLQYPGTKPVPVRAIAAGRLVALGPDPNGFGQVYPGEILSSPIAGHREVYYGHIVPDPHLIGHHVSAGEVIAMTGGRHSGGNAYSESNWLELGFWPPRFSTGPTMAAVLHNPAGRRVIGRSGKVTPVNTNPGGFFGSLDSTFMSIAVMGPLIILGAGMILWGAARATGAKQKAEGVTSTVSKVAGQAAGAAALAA